MSENILEFGELEKKHNNEIKLLLNSIPNTSISQAPPPTQVEDVDNTPTILHDTGKTVRFRLDKLPTAPRQPWQRRKAKKEHVALRERARELIANERHTQKLDAKRLRRNERRGGYGEDQPSIVPDSGATSTCIRQQDTAYVEVLDEMSPKTFLNANGSISQAGRKAKLPFNMREPAVDADTVPDLAMNSLLSTSKTADANYITVFTPDEVKIFDNEMERFHCSGKLVLQGWRCPKTKLWRIPLTPHIENMNTDTAILSSEVTAIMMEKRGQFEPTDLMNSVYELPNLEQVVAWYHAAAGYPTKASWLKAIDAGFYATWPLLMAKAVRRHFPESEETVKGHLRRVKSGVRSTKAQVEEPEEIQQAEAALAELRRKHRDIYVTVKESTDMIHTDQTGRFPVTSRLGHKYIMVLVEIDGNYIAMEPMRSRDTRELIRTYQAMLGRLKQQGIHPKKHILDNEAPREYLDTIEAEGLDWELVPPTNHRRLIAERAIQTAKGHVIANILGCDKSYPVREWHRLIPQMELTLNMLRPSNLRPTVSAYAYVYGTHDYNRMPIAPLGCRTQCFVDPDNRKSFGAHSVDSHYLGHSREHYRVAQVLCTETNSERLTDTIVYFHRHITCPRVSVADAVSVAAAELTKAIQGNLKDDITTVDLKELERLADIFQKAAMKVSDADAAAPRVEDEETAAEQQAPRVDQLSTEQQAGATAVPSTTEKETAQQKKAAPTPRVASPSMQEAERLAPPKLRRSRRLNTTMTTDAMLTVMELSGRKVSPQKLAGRQFPLEFLCEVAGAVMDEGTGDMLEYRQLIKRPKYRDTWSKAFGKEIGRLAQGQEGVVEGTNAIFFIPHADIPAERRKDVTYARIVADHRPEKADPNRIRITLGGNLVNYPGDVGTRTADLLTVKLLLNSVISTPGAKFMSLDISNFYLMAPMTRYEYVRMNLDDFPDEIIDEYNLREIAKDGHVIAECRKCVYGLPQAGILANKYLEKRLNEYGYYQSDYTNGLWSHKSRPIQFALCVDDFGVKYINDYDVEHLKAALQAENPETGKPMFEITCDEEGSRFCGLFMDWDYEKRLVHISIPGYVQAALTRFQHRKPSKPQNQPYPHNPKQYGSKAQYVEPLDDSPLLNKADKKFIQEVTGTFLFYARAVDPTMLVALGSLAVEQANPTERTMEKCKQFLDYAASQEDAVITYRKSDMVLAIHSDASYLSEPKARSRAGGHFFMSEAEEDPRDNGAVHTVAKIIKSVMSSAAEAELGGLFINAKTAVPIRTTLEELGHKQPPTPIQTDNSTACGVVNNEIQPKATKAMDMRFYWLKDRENKKQFRIYWRRGSLNRGDYVTKHHPAVHHQAIRPTLLTPWKVVEALRQKLKQSMNSMTGHAARVC